MRRYWGYFIEVWPVAALTVLLVASIVLFTSQVGTGGP